MKTILRAVMPVLMLGILPALAADLSVGAGEEMVISTSPAASYQVATIEGSLTVDSGATVVGVNNRIGSATGQPATLTVDGAGSAYGECTSTISTCITNALGGKIVLKNGGAFNCYHFDIAKDVAANPVTGFIEVMEVDGSTTWKARERHNYSEAPARISVKSGTLSLTSTSTASYRYFKNSKGKWVVDLASGAGVLFATTRSSEFLSQSTTVEFVGEGDVVFENTGSVSGRTLSLTSTTSFGQTGVLHFNKVSPTIPASGVTITNVLKLLKVSNATLTCNAALALNAIEAANGGVFTGSGSITMGTGDADASITGDLGAASTLAFVKVGSGELTLSPETTRLASLDVQGGSVRIKGAFASPSLTVAAGASLVVDGTTMTIDGNWFNCTGSFATTNRASLVVKTATGNTPVFPAGARVTVSEYWIDGVKQSRGEYTLGDATIRVVPPWSEEGLTTWTNDDAAQAAWTFAAEATYLGLSLVSPAEDLTFTGGDLTLGSGGIAVDGTVTANSSYDFNLPIAVGSTQTWDFGPAAVVLRKGVSIFEGTTDAPALAIKANSAGDNAPALIFCGGVFEPELSLTVPACTSDKTAAAVRFEANTETVFRQYVQMPCDTSTTTRYVELGAGAVVEFAGGARFVNRNVLTLDTGSQLIFRGKFVAGRVIGLRGINVKKINDGGSVLFDVSEITYETSNPSADYTFTVNMPWTLARDYSFVKGCVQINEDGVFNLAGHPQKVEKLIGAGTVTSFDPVTGDALPAVVELDYAADSTFTSSLTFAGGAGLRKLGEGTLVVNGGDVTGSGIVSIEAGEVQLNGNWAHASDVRVSGGTLTLSSSESIGADVELHLTGTGVLAVPKGCILRVAKIWVPDPSDPTKEITLANGRYDVSSTATSGRIASGAVRVGVAGITIIVR